MKVLYKLVYTDVWFNIRTSNSHKWCKSIPLADNKHCYESTNKFNLWTIITLMKQLIVSILTSLWKKFIHKNLHCARIRTDSGKIRGFGCGFGIRNNTTCKVLLRCTFETLIRVVNGARVDREYSVCVCGCGW